MKQREIICKLLLHSFPSEPPLAQLLRPKQPPTGSQCEQAVQSMDRRPQQMAHHQVAGGAD